MSITPNIHRFNVGELAAIAIADGGHSLDDSFAQPFVNAAPDEVTAAGRAWLAANPGVNHALSYTCFVLETPGGRVLIDTGNGPASESAGQLPSGLAAAGLAPADIDLVILTHAHTDHINGNTDAAGAPRLPQRALPDR